MRVTRTAAVCAVLLATYMWWQLGKWGGSDHETLIGDLFFVPLNLLAVLTAWRAGQRCASPRLRQSWQLISAALLMYLVGDLLQTYSEVVAHGRPFPSWADAGYISFYPLLLAGLLRLPSARRDARQRLIIVLDCALVALAAAVPIWYLSLGPTIAAGGQGTLAMVVSVAYPLGDMVLLVGLSAILFRPLVAGLRGPLTLVGVGLVGFVATDLVYGWIELHGSYSGGDLVDAGWMVSLVFFAMAGAAQSVRSDSDYPLGLPTAHRRRVSWLPYTGLGTTLAFAVSLQWNDSLTVRLVFAAAVLLAVLVSARQLVVQGELLGTQEQLRVAQLDRASLLDRTLRHGEHERIRIAGELHDGAVQRLTATGYLLERAVRLGRRGDTDQTLSLVEEALRDVRSEIGGLRRLMSDLRPPVLDQSGLDNAVRDQLAKLFGKTEVTVEFVSLLGADRLCAETETVFYRVAQEALLNVAQHASAGRVRVLLERTPDAAVLVIEDDGAGFGQEEARARLREGHFGLIGMRESVELGGGSCVIDSTPGAGTRITAMINHVHRDPRLTGRVSNSHQQVPA